MGRRPKLDNDSLQQQALALLDEVGSSGLSIRALAARLNTAPMTLYNYVATREQLDVLLVDLVMDKIDLELDGSLSWQQQLTQLTHRTWRAIWQHPHIIPLLLVRRSQSKTTLAWSETILQILALSGRAEQRLLFAFRTVSALILGMAQNDLVGQLALSAGQQKADTIAHIQALDNEQFVHLKSVARHAAQIDAQQELDAAMAIVLAGLAAS